MNEMTSLQRVQAVMRGEVPDRLPVIPQNFLFCAFTAGYHIGQINRNPAKMADSHRVCQEKYGYDGCVIDVDDATMAEACGARVIYRDENVATVDEHHPILNDLRDIDNLHMPNPYKDGRIPLWLETTQRLMEKIGDHVFIMGRADQGPFSLLSLLRGTENFMMDLITEDEATIFHAMEWATRAHTAFAKAQLAAGAHASSMGDAYASPNLISPDMYVKFALPYEKKATEQLADTGKPYSVHICGNTSSIIKQMGSIGCQILEVDWQMDLGLARKLIDEKTILMGNVNPSDPLVLGTPEAVSDLVRKCIDATKGIRYIISSGCAMGENTKPENMEALIRSAKLYGTYERLMELQAQ